MINGHAYNVESQLEYIENQSRPKNIKILGIEENKDEEKTWDDTEVWKLESEVCKSAKANCGKVSQVERQRVNPKKARSLKPVEVKFFPNYAKRKLEKKSFVVG